MRLPQLLVLLSLLRKSYAQSTRDCTAFEMTMNLAESETGVDVGWNGGCSVGGCHPLTMTVFSSLTAGVLSLFSATNTVQWLDYKLCVMMHNIHVGKAPRYLSDALQLMSTRVTRSDLRSSSDTTSYTILHLKTKFGERAFS